MDLLIQLKKEVLHFNNQVTVFNNRDTFYKHKAWTAKRAYIVERDNNECKACADRGLVTIKNLIVHHIKPIEFVPKLSLDDDNLITVCISCHNYIHGNAFDHTDIKNKWHDDEFY